MHRSYRTGIADLRDLPEEGWFDIKDDGFFIVLPRSSTQWADCAFILHSCRDLSPNDRKQGRSKAMERGLESPKSPAKVEGGGGCRDVPGAAEGEHQTPTKEEGDQRSVTYRLESKGERECRSKGT